MAGFAWSPNRETARLFAYTVDAHSWGKEQEYFDAEIVLTYPDPGHDYPCLRT